MGCLPVLMHAVHAIPTVADVAALCADLADMTTFWLDPTDRCDPPHRRG